MRALTYTGSGGVEVLALAERPDPVPAAHQIRVRVHAAGLNRADILQRRGRYPAPPGWPPDIPGLEYAGVVESVGEGVTRWHPGDRVMGLVGGGGHAEYVVVQETEALPAPGHLSDAEAAAIPEAFLTGYDALVTRGRLSHGEGVLIHAVASGVGTAAVQLAKVLGATVLGTSRTADKLERLAGLGLDLGIQVSGGSFREQITLPVHLILDVLGGPAFQDNLALLEPRGRLVLLGFLQGSAVPMISSRLRRIGLRSASGTAMRTRGLEERSALIAEFAGRVLPLFGPHFRTDSPMLSMSHPEQSDAVLRPIVHGVFPMAEAAAAHDAMEGNGTVGKVVLTW
jgi:NADPH:quinone reductase-like Zn-dependent oxidoreductase